VFHNPKSAFLFVFEVTACVVSITAKNERETDSSTWSFVKGPNTAIGSDANKADSFSHAIRRVHHTLNSPMKVAFCLVGIVASGFIRQPVYGLSHLESVNVDLFTLLALAWMSLEFLRTRK
jgi:hypothetical protein